jgi:predicted ATPase
MILSRFGVKYYKCLGEIDIPLTPIHVLIGENDAGKTSLLEALASFCATSQMELTHVFPTPWSGRELVLHGQTTASIELFAEWKADAASASKTAESSVRYGLTLDFPPTGQRCTVSDEWLETGRRRRSLRQGKGFTQTALLRWKRGESVPDEAVPHLETISRELKPAHKYSLDPKAMAVPAAIDHRRKFRLDADGFGLATLLLDILGNDPSLFIRLRDEFCAFFPQFKSVRIESENAVNRSYDPGGNVTGSQQRVGSGIFFETRSGETIRAQQASDGAVLFLGFLALAHLPDPPGLLLIEEPENGVYSKRLGAVIEMLKALSQRNGPRRFPQIVLTTHSPYMLSFFEPDEVTFLSRRPDEPDSPVRARPLADAPHIQERLADGEFYLGELWYNLSEEDLFGEP